MSVKFASFAALTGAHKHAALLNIKEKGSRKRDDFLLAAFALDEEDAQVRLTAKLVYGLFADCDFFLDIKGLGPEEARKKLRQAFPELRGARPELIEWSEAPDAALMAKNLQTRTLKAEQLKEWDGPFPKPLFLLNALREDTQALLLRFFGEQEKLEHAYLGCYHEPLKPYREGVRSLEAAASALVVSLTHMSVDLPNLPTLQTLSGMLERPIYLLVILSNERLVLFLRESLKECRAAVQSIPYSQIKRVSSTVVPRGMVLEIETGHDLYKIPTLFSQDGLELDRILREKSVESIQASESLLDIDIDKEMSRLQMLYKARTISHAEFMFRKSRFQKMELEKFSEKNLELLLAKRFSDGQTGKKLDEQLLAKFTSIRTIMFTDIVGYSRKAAEKMLLDTMTLLAVHDKLLMPIIANFGGKLIKKIGDALMVKFDEAPAGCQAAREMQQALIKFNRTSAEKILIRIGLNTGTVFVKNEDVFGDAVNVAARMEAMAQPGRIFITESTFQALQGKMPAQFLGERQVKGQKLPIRVYALTDETQADQEMVAQAQEFRREMGIEEPSEDAVAGGSGASGPSSAPAAALPPGAEPGPAPSQGQGPGPGVLRTIGFGSPEEAMTAMGESLDAAISCYKAAVRLGWPRNAALEDWFNRFVRDVKPRL